jgi:predicted acetyltransferase
MNLDIIPWYYKTLASFAIIAAVALFFYNKGYDRADDKWELKITREENIALTNEIKRRKLAEDLLSKEKEKNNELDKAYAKAIKTDPSYKCVIPDSLVRYINSI